MSLSAEKRCLSLGFIGGSIDSAVGHTHQIASQMDGRWQLVAGCFSRNKSVNDKTAAEWGLSSERTYSTYKALIEKEQGKLDAIVVLTPTPSHTDIVIAALDAGYAVICEKTLSTSSQEALLIEESVKRNNGFLAVTLNYSGYPMMRELRRIIKAGDLGRVQQIQIEMPQEGFIRLDAEGNQTQPQAWRLRDNTVPTISLDLGIHLHHIIHYLTQERPVDVVADQASYGWFKDVVDSVTCMLRYTDDIRCQMWFSKTALGHRNGLKVRVFGDRGSAEWLQVQPEELLLSYINGKREIVDRASFVSEACLPRYNRFKAGHPAGFIEAFANIYCDMADCYFEYKNTGTYTSREVYGVSHAVEGLQLFEAIALSVKKRCWVSI
ncbi:Gfo/Idh/MocA family protein [Alkalimarinus alittae]|uniref:Gfo/Idh/MocA family oxidoreductase n=1 Tax=Alkalimarinus alittae TaxID=2961619 RepID=A0ABY6N6C0_9ALTE|nr:Gfo/Idh/MocA family oxidoreductase [Alkalimarinus alittae]UZE97560.1 Gfo/Idh/MocA family oxidoreductase [Alkalimarinus alittae]